MNLDTLNDMWDKDSQLDDEKLDHDSLESQSYMLNI